MDKCGKKKCESWCNEYANNCCEFTSDLLHLHCRFFLKETEAPSSSLSSVGLVGPWKKAGKMRLIHEDFKHDMMLQLSGDFGSDEDLEKHLEAIMNKLNQAD